jgi:hypothetical protein
MAEKIDFLGHTIGKKGMMATSKDISGMEIIESLTSKKKMLSF